MSVPVIYALHCVDCPGEGVRYIGQTVMRPQDRLQAHKYDAERGRITGVCGWIRKHGRENIAQVVLEECALDELNAREAWWISFFLEKGARLHNMTRGGDTARALSMADVTDIRYLYGSEGMIQSAIAKIYGVSQATISQVVKGKYGGGDDLARDGKGRPKPHSSFSGEANGMAKLTWAQVDDIRAQYAAGGEIRDIADASGIKYARAWAIIRGKAWTKRPASIGAAALAN